MSRDLVNTVFKKACEFSSFFSDFFVILKKYKKEKQKTTQSCLKIDCSKYNTVHFFFSLAKKDICLCIMR